MGTACPYYVCVYLKSHYRFPAPGEREAYPSGYRGLSLWAHSNMPPAGDTGKGHERHQGCVSGLLFDRSIF